jgi:hypothetical protein
MLTKANFFMKKVGLPIGTITVNVRGSGDSVKLAMGTKDISTLATSYVETEFENLTGVLLASGDRISVEYAGGSGSDYLDLQVSSTNQYDGSNTIEFYYGGSYTDNTGREAKFNLYGY